MECIKKRDFGVQTELSIDPSLVLNLKNDKKSANEVVNHSTRNFEISQGFSWNNEEIARGEKEGNNECNFFNLIML